QAATLTPWPPGACRPVLGGPQVRPAPITGPATANLCPGGGSPPGSDYETTIDCCHSPTSPAPQYECGNPVATWWDALLVDPALSNQTNQGLHCVTNHPSEDTLDPTDLSPVTGPAKITAGSGPKLGILVTTSRLIATFLVI